MLKFYSVHDVVLSCESRDSKVFFVKLTFQMESGVIVSVLFV